MLRKTILAGAAALTLGAAALAPTTASAWWGGPSRLAWMASWLVLPAGGSGLCRSDLWRLLGSPAGLDALRPGAALGQCLLLTTRLPCVANAPAVARGVLHSLPSLRLTA
jgi:hypothetical protein